jgi:transcriptional regulator with PAS, ATPase and Fis domain
MKNLMEKAIDTTVRELDADEGFIVLVNDNLEIETVVSKNMPPEKENAVKEISTSIIKNTVNELKPLQLDDIKAEAEFAQKHSIISLGLSAAISVPLISGDKVLGAVYLDRRNKDNPFVDGDLIFLIAFAKQIVKGLVVSLEIEDLEERLEERPKIEFNELRQLFKSDDLIGTGNKLFSVLKLASKVSATDASVLVLGENGTGKELLARAIHANSSRKDKPFVAVNCGAIPSELLESELFGYESGAFTGAVKSKPGRMEIADGGTIFLDEIGEMGINLQAKLLRVIQTKEIERLGSVQIKKIDVRFIAATNRDLTQMISDKLFREDLYYRLKVIEIVLPPLRERREDIQELTNHFIKKYSGNSDNYSISEEALEILEQYNWPGNIRELENIIQRAIILSKSEIITKDDLPPELMNDAEAEYIFGNEKSLAEAENEFRKLYITKVLRKFKSKSDVAKILGVNRSHLHKILTSLEITI